MVKLVVLPAVFGVPLSVPLSASERPGGSGSLVSKEYGALPPTAVITCVYGVPLVPFGMAFGCSVVVKVCAAATLHQSATTAAMNSVAPRSLAQRQLGLQRLPKRMKPTEVGNRPCLP